jgi:prefoldin subunit 5
MFFNKKISELEKRVEVLEEKVQKLSDWMNKTNVELDELMSRYKERSNKPQGSTIPNRRRRKNSDGEEITITRD